GTWMTSLPPQRRVGLSCGWLLLLPFDMRSGSREDSVRVALYRPGFSLIWLRKDEPTGDLGWRPAEDARAQAWALDDLFFPGTRREESERGCVYEHVTYGESWRLDPGSAAPAHREVLLFGAAEYDRLANQIAGGRLPTSDVSLTDLLRNRAAHLRDL